MITSIDKLKNLGIYKDFNFKTIADFKRYNLIYGWNGSGKSTLSRMFDFLSGKEIPENFVDLKYLVTIDGKQYSEKADIAGSENILVFNEDFVKENIDWNGTIKSILLLDEANIEVVKKFNELKNEL